jgi:hypothetical protein
VSHISEPTTQRFGGDERRNLHGLQGEITLQPSTAISATVRADKGQALVKLGTLHIIAALEELEVTEAAFAWSVKKLVQPADELPPEDPISDKWLCTHCAITHSRTEPCASLGGDRSREEAYRLMAKTHCLSGRQAQLMVDSAALWVNQGDPVAARMLLHQFVVDDVANKVVDILVNLAGYTWTHPVPTPPPSMNGVPHHS